jgi:hypothetical protein
MVAGEDKEDLEIAIQLLEGFASRTGLIGSEGNIERRYLWTDAFAVQAFFGLAHACEDEIYRNRALKLIELVHEKLGHYHPNDNRNGWISGLSEEDGKKHPTAGGLRIGKKLPERQADEAFHERLEWERDGQYFHYITRWINTLLQAGQETGEQKFAIWAAELLQAGGKFIDKKDGRLRMYWKMSIDLSRPLVPSMGAHDPLEGLICAESAKETAPEKAPELEPLLPDFKKLCAGQDWSTSDALGISGLLLNTLRAAELASTITELPQEIRPEKLWTDSHNGLKRYARRHNAFQSANQRLAFRECGLSLGLRALEGFRRQSSDVRLELDELDRFMPLADEIESFWKNPEHQRASTLTEHLDINAVTLASSLVARYAPFSFSAIQGA